MTRIHKTVLILVAVIALVLGLTVSKVLDAPQPDARAALLDAGIVLLPQSRSLPGLAVPADGQSKKVQALWITLHQAGVVRDGSDQAMLNFVKRLTGRDRLQWCSTEQKSDVIQALKAMAARAGLRGEA